MSIGIAVISHSENVAKGIKQLIREVAKDIPLVAVGGTEDGGIGTSFERINQAIDTLPANQVLAFFDLGSAKMNLELVCDFSEKEIYIQSTPILEGSYTASALLQAGADLDTINQQLKELQILK